MAILYNTITLFGRSSFRFQYSNFFRASEVIPGVIQYVRSGWTSSSSPWRSLWHKFKRLFCYGGMDTTNHVEAWKVDTIFISYEFSGGNNEKREGCNLGWRTYTSRLFQITATHK